MKSRTAAESNFMSLIMRAQNDRSLVRNLISVKSKLSPKSVARGERDQYKHLGEGIRMERHQKRKHI